MIRKIQTLCVLLVFAAGCAPTGIPSTTTPTAVATTTPTDTPIPLGNLSGVLFFDRNGSGTIESNELPIANFGVCANIEYSEKTCTETNEKGKYFFKSISPLGSQISLSFADPNADNPSLAFTYINNWNGEKFIPSVEINGARIPEQNLQDTEVVPISRGVKVTVGNHNIIGLMQGLFTMPFPKSTEYSVTTWYDLDSRVNHGLNWKGDISTSKYDSKAQIFDNHYGIDWLVLC